MGATIHKDAIVEPYAVVAAGAVVPEGTVVMSGQVWAGNPAKYLRDVTQEEKHQISEYSIEMQQLSQIY
jgi:gamma-carbonic anhydrase